MTKLILVLMIIGLGFEPLAQSREMAPGDSIPWELRKQSFIYNSANLFNDPVMVRMAIYNLLAENPENVALYDTLALIYLQANQNASAALVAQQALIINPNDMFATEIAATGFDKIGVKDRALTHYEKLYLGNGDLNTLYKISFLQFELERFTESGTSLDIIIENPQSKELNIRFPTDDGVGQEIPLDVTAHRVKAMIEEAKGNIETAQNKYLEVLEMYPGFHVVQQQLREITKGGEK